jgi:hypothetical protein
MQPMKELKDAKILMKIDLEDDNLKHFFSYRKKFKSVHRSR